MNKLLTFEAKSCISPFFLYNDSIIEYVMEARVSSVPRIMPAGTGEREICRSGTDAIPFCWAAGEYLADCHFMWRAIVYEGNRRKCVLHVYG